MFKLFLEHQLTLEQRNNLKVIIQALLNKNKDFFDKNDIIATEKGDYWILNYIQSQNKNEFNSLVRGLVVKKPKGDVVDPLSLIVSFPFIRFYNQGEKQAANIDIENSEMIEKLDGTMIGVFFPYGDPKKPEFHTRKMLSSHQPDFDYVITSFYGKKYSLLKLAKSYIEKINFTQEDVYYTYVFELIHEATMVVTKYTPDQYGLYLTGARNIKNHLELTEKELDEVARRLNLRRPRRFDAVSDQDKINKMFKSMNIPDFEGFVFRDKNTGNRIKVKDPDYVRKHHWIEKLTVRRLLQVVLNKEEDEVLSYFPHALKTINEIKNSIEVFLDKAADFVLYWMEVKKDADIKTMAIRLQKEEKNQFLIGITFEIVRKFNSITKEQIKDFIIKKFKEIALDTDKRSGNPSKVAQILNLEDSE